MIKKWSLLYDQEVANTFDAVFTMLSVFNDKRLFYPNNAKDIQN